MTKRELTKAIGNLDLRKKNRDNYVPGILGFILNGIKTVEVPTRPGFVYVRLRNSTNELIQAFNDQVSPVYDLPVLITRDDVDRTRYKVVGRDLGVYQNWGSSSSYLPRHGNTHSFDPDNGGGGDLTFVFSRQMMPLAVYPSGSFGAGLAMVSPHTYYQNDDWHYAGGVATPSLLPYKPTGSTARMVLVYLDENDNPQLLAGSTFFSESITGSSAIVPYLPDITSPIHIPLAGIRLVSGTSVILWENIYDVRLWVSNYPTGSSSAGGISTPTYPAIYDDSVFRATGVHISFEENLFVRNTGTSVFVGISTGVYAPATHFHPGLDQGLLIFDDGVFKGTGIVIDFRDNINVIASGTSIFVSSVDTGGGGGSALVVYDDSVFKATGTAISFDRNLDVHVTGSTVYVDAIIPTGSSVYWDVDAPPLNPTLIDDEFNSSDITQTTFLDPKWKAYNSWTLSGTSSPFSYCKYGNYWFNPSTTGSNFGIYQETSIEPDSSGTYSIVGKFSLDENFAISSYAGLAVWVDPTSPTGSYSTLTYEADFTNNRRYIKHKFIEDGNVLLTQSVTGTYNESSIYLKLDLNLLAASYSYDGRSWELLPALTPYIFIDLVKVGMVFDTGSVDFFRMFRNGDYKPYSDYIGFLLPGRPVLYGGGGGDIYNTVEQNITNIYGGGGAGSVLIYDDGVFKSTGTSLSFQGNIGVAVTGSFTYIYDEDLDRQVVFTVENSLAVAVGGIRIPNRSGRNRTLLGVYLDLGTPPTVNSVIIDVNKGAECAASPTTVFTNQANRPVVTTGSYCGQSTNLDVSSWSTGEYLTMDVDQIGSGTAGSNLTVTVVYR